MTTPTVPPTSPQVPPTTVQVVVNWKEAAGDDTVTLVSPPATAVQPARDLPITGNFDVALVVIAVTFTVIGTTMCRLAGRAYAAM